MGNRSVLLSRRAALKSLVPSDTLCYLRQSDLLATPFRVEKGYITVPNTPGLGVSLDEAALKRYRVT